MSDTEIRVSHADGIATIIIDGQATMNALSVHSARSLNAALDTAERRARVILLAGAGEKAFCTGADLGSRPDPQWIDDEGRMDAAMSIQEVFNPLVTRLRDCSIPIVTAVRGAAAGFGCVLALLGDIVVAGESTYFIQTFRRLGLVPDGGSTYVLTRMLGKARAMEMMLMGSKVSAARAQEWGLVNRVVPDAEVMPRATEIAHEIGSGPLSLGMIRQLVWQGMDSTWHEQVHRESVLQRKAAFSEDFAEGVAAFKEKRAPIFKGR